MAAIPRRPGSGLYREVLSDLPSLSAKLKVPFRMRAKSGLSNDSIDWHVVQNVVAVASLLHSIGFHIPVAAAQCVARASAYNYRMPQQQ